MGFKRRLDDAASSNHTTSSKRRRYEPAQSKQLAFGKIKPQPKANPLNPLRSRIRSLRRLLTHDDDVDAALNNRADGSKAHEQQQQLLHDKDELESAAKHEKRDQKRQKRLPAQIRLERERELAGLEGKVAELEAKQRRGAMIAKWHMVRFFERRKAEKHVKRARRALKAMDGQEDGEKGARVGKEERAGLESALHKAEVDLNYALYYPLEKAYVSLWPKQKDKNSKDDALTEGEGDGKDVSGKMKGDLEMWKLVEKCMAEGRLEALKEGKVDGCGIMDSVPHFGAESKSKSFSKRAKINGGHEGSKASQSDGVSSRGLADAGHKAADIEEDSDDGGFFEK